MKKFIMGLCTFVVASGLVITYFIKLIKEMDTHGIHLGEFVWVRFAMIISYIFVVFIAFVFLRWVYGCDKKQKELEKKVEVEK